MRAGENSTSFTFVTKTKDKNHSLLFWVGRSPENETKKRHQITELEPTHSDWHRTRPSTSSTRQLIDAVLAANRDVATDRRTNRRRTDGRPAHSPPVKRSHRTRPTTSSTRRLRAAVLATNGDRQTDRRLQASATWKWKKPHQITTFEQWSVVGQEERLKYSFL